jgi:hypothetical protein
LGAKEEQKNRCGKRRNRSGFDDGKKVFTRLLDHICVPLLFDRENQLVWLFL